MSNNRSGGRIVVDCLVKQDVTTVFGIPGESYLDVLNSLYDVQNRIRLITTRNEGGAAFMAEAYGKLTGRPGICFVTRGPGATNASIGVHTAKQNSTPMILFVGQIGRDMRQREAFQEVDYRQYFGSIAKWVTEIDNPDRIPETIARAFTVAISGRPGPVVIALPEDMLGCQSTVEACKASQVFEAAPSANGLTNAIALLKSVQKPLVMIGGGGWSDQGRQALLIFAEQNNLPVAAVFRYQDLLDNRSETYIGDAGVGMAAHVKDAIMQADLILALNIRLGESATEGWTLLDVPCMKPKLIHIHASDRELGKIYQADVALHAGPNEAVKAFAAAGPLGDWNNWRAQGRKAFLAMRSKAKQLGAVDMVAICAWLNENLTSNAILTNGAGNFASWPSKFIDLGGGRRLLAPQSGAMGAGLPAAIAAKAAEPSRQVICFAGDGDIQMNMTELGTAMQEGLAPIVLLLNNGMYGTIRAHQEREYPGRVSGTKIQNPDFCKLAESYGFFAKTITNTEDFSEAFEAATQSTTGALLELIIDPQDISPFTSLDKIRNP